MRIKTATMNAMYLNVRSSIDTYPVCVVDVSTTGLTIVAGYRRGVKFCKSNSQSGRTRDTAATAVGRGRERKAPDRLKEGEQGKIGGLGVPIQF